MLAGFLAGAGQEKAAGWGKAGHTCTLLHRRGSILYLSDLRGLHCTFCNLASHATETDVAFLFYTIPGSTWQKKAKANEMAAVLLVRDGGRHGGRHEGGQEGGQESQGEARGAGGQEVRHGAKRNEGNQGLHLSTAGGVDGQFSWCWPARTWPQLKRRLQGPRLACSSLLCPLLPGLAPGLALRLRERLRERLQHGGGKSKGQGRSGQRAGGARLGCGRA